ncbi:hypothetical protein BDZ91DRAFT_781007 [Kalaharituber pfeilii]|nr:hypothetical protein BDZ91DRAFT_781007 [Kalaharituber pfeilii]
MPLEAPIVDPPPPSDLTITLHQPAIPHTQDRPSLSGYCQKLETFFRLVNFTSYTNKPTAFSATPRGKLPFVTLHHPAPTPPEIISDSHFIIKTLISPLQRTESRALRAWTEEQIYLAIVQTRWARDHNYSHITESFPVPWLLKPAVLWFLRRKIVNAIWIAGMGRFTPEEVDDFIVEWLDGLETRLADGRDWLLGTTEPWLVDATIWGFLVNVLEVGEGNRETLEWVKQRKGVVMFVKRGWQRWFPEYDVPGMLGEKSVEENGESWAQ